MIAEMISKIRTLFEDYQDHHKNKDLKKIQDHNFSIFLKQICDLDSLKNLKEKCIDEIEKPSENYANNEDCVKANIDFEACLHIQGQIKSMYKIRQYNYFKERKEKEI